MKYNLYFDKGDGGYGDQVDTWKNETVVPRVGDSVFMANGGWLTVVSVSFSREEKRKRRNVYITVK